MLIKDLVLQAVLQTHIAEMAVHHQTVKRRAADGVSLQNVLLL
jgi:hypothetical protein